jgi:CHAD domain-containing protein
MRRRVWFEARGIASGALGAQLRQFGYKILPSESVELGVTYYDTQDGRLHKRRARLSFRSGAAEVRGRWLLEQEDAFLESVCGDGCPPEGGVGKDIPEGARALGIHPVGPALPEGELLTKKLEALAAGKALLPVLRARVTGERFGAVAPDGGFAELFCQRWVFYPPFAAGLEESNCPEPLDFVELAARPGGDGPETDTTEFAYLSILLRDLMGFASSEPDHLILGLESLDRPLPGAPVPSRYTVSGDDPLPAAVCKVLGAQAYKMRANTEGTLLDLDPEFLHDLRVATRRSRFALKYARLVAERKVCDAQRDELAWVSGALGPVRDVDVLSQGLAEQLERTEAPDDARQLIRGLIAGRRARAFVDLKKMLESERYRAVVDRLSTFQACVPASEGTPPSIPAGRSSVSTAREAVSGLVRKALKRVRKTAEGRVGGAADSQAADFAPDALHELRIAFKGLRYTCEFFLPVFGEGMREAVRKIVAFQDCLGRFQDAMTAAELLKNLLHEALRGGPDVEQESLRGERGVKADMLLAFGALIQIQRDAGLVEQKRFSELWRSFKNLDRKLRRLVGRRKNV